MSNLQAIAEDLRVQFAAGTWYEALIPHLADSIDIAHRPTPAPDDGPTTAAALAATMRDNHAGVGFHDARQTLEDLAVDGNTITAAQVLTASLADGSPIRVRLTQKFLFRDDAMVGLEHHANEADVEAAMRAVAASAAPASD